MKNVKSLWLSLLALTLSSCSHTQFPDFPVFSVAGDLQAGADYTWVGHDEVGEISMQEVIDILEDGAIIIRSNDWKRQKAAGETACIALGSMCSQQVLESLRNADERSKRLGTKPSVYE